MNVPKKVAERITSGLKALRPIIEQQVARDVSEADTVTLVKDLLDGVAGYDKYTEMTSEHAIRGTYCDIVVSLKGQHAVIVEVKAVGVALDDKHVKQAVDYAANQGVDWVILTNARAWRLYKVVFAKPIDKHLVCEVDLMADGVKRTDEADVMYPFTKEAHLKGVPAEILDRKLALSRHTIAALLVHCDKVTDTIRRELKRIASVNVEISEITQLLRDEVIKRDALDGPAAVDAATLVNKREDRKLRNVAPAPATAPSEADNAPPPDVADDRSTESEGADANP